MRAIEIYFWCGVLALAGACGSVGPSENNNSASVCGNGVVEPGEACDDGNQVDDPVCSADCRSFCGDGVRDEALGEACDGADLGGKTCESLGLPPGTLSCQQCLVESTGCAPTCGDGICHQGEHSGCPQDCAVVEMALSQRVSCAVLADGSARCWGSASRLGTDEVEEPDNLVPVRVKTEGVAAGPRTLDGGMLHTCAALDSGEVRCWGANHEGQLGDDTTEERILPTPVLGITTVAAVSAGMQSSCALLADGSVSCWGPNAYGMLGLGDPVDMSAVPVAISSLPPVEVLASSGVNNCVVLADGTVRCWGLNDFGQLGDGQGGAGAESAVPVEVVGISDAVVVAAGGYHTCALLASGSVQCWGANLSGQLGDGTNDDSPVPVDVVGLSEITYLTAFGSITCAVSQSGTVHCWGFGGGGLLGDGTDGDSNVPVEVLNIDNGVGVDCAQFHVCAWLADGTARCWGMNGSGQLGNGTQLDSNVPVEVQFD